MPVAPTASVIQAQIKAIREKTLHSRTFGIYSPARWTGAQIVGEGKDRVFVYQCDSPLQMRLALQEMPADANAVLITPLNDASVSEDILVRLARRRLYNIKPWEIVRSLFKARELDPRIVKHGILADLLLEHAATHDLPPAVGGIVDAETVWEVLLSSQLGLRSPRPDLTDLLRHVAEGELVPRWQASLPKFREAATEWLTEYAGESAAAVLRCIESDAGPQAVAVGLVLGVIFSPVAGPEMERAAGRVERYTGEMPLTPLVARHWHEAAATCAGLLDPEHLRPVLEDADRILAAVGAGEYAWFSDILPSGFEQRLGRFGAALAAHLESRATALPAALVNARADLGRHRWAQVDQRRQERVEMAVRLARWLVEQGRTAGASPLGLAEAARQYVADGAFVDWARQVLRGGEPNQDLAGAYVRLVDAVTEVREKQNARFAQLLQEQENARRPAPDVCPVESLLKTIAAPAAQAAPLLIILMDGMSWAVFRELVASIKTRKWSEVLPEGKTKRLLGLAALPSVTEVCRASLFNGTLGTGAAPQELAGFAQHPDLLAVSTNNLPPRLFHKAALEGDDDTSLAREIREAIADPKQRVVGLVINAVDDQLDKGEQLDHIWSVQQIRVLGPVLAAADDAARMVLLVADHGHVLDRQTELRRNSDGHRWRKADGAPEAGEILIESPRVLLPEGGRIIVPWSERIRYGAKKNGYHGGATPQEMLAPVSLLWPGQRPPAGYTELAADQPGWWTEPLVDVPGVSMATTPVAKPDTRATPLFDAQPEKPREAAAPPPAWLERLVVSETYLRQRALVSRTPIDDQKVIRLLTALVVRGGSMTGPALAGVLQLPEHRLSGHLAIMQRLLNVEGYAILDRQEPSNTILLNLELLKRQFDLSL